MNKPLSITPDMDLAEKLRNNFTAHYCVEETMRAVAEMVAAIGVTVSWEIVKVDDDADVDKERLTKALGKFATASGSLLMGGKVNPITALAIQDPMRMLRDRGKQ